MVANLFRSASAILLLSALLTGCGFQLKGSAQGSDPSLIGQSIRLISDEPRNELTAAIGQQLKLAGAILNEPDAATLVLRLGAEQFQQRNLSLTAQARSAEVELTMSTYISLNRADDVLIPKSEASVVRQFLNDPQNVVGKTEELRLLREEMYADLASQIIRRIGHSLNN